MTAPHSLSVGIHSIISRLDATGFQAGGKGMAGPWDEHWDLHTIRSKDGRRLPTLPDTLLGVSYLRLNIHPNAHGGMFHLRQ